MPGLRKVLEKMMLFTKKKKKCAMKLEELSLNTKVEIDTKHQGFYGYK